MRNKTEPNNVNTVDTPDPVSVPPPVEAIPPPVAVPIEVIEQSPSNEDNHGDLAPPAAQASVLSTIPVEDDDHPLADAPIVSTIPINDGEENAAAAQPTTSACYEVWGMELLLRESIGRSRRRNSINSSSQSSR